MQDHPFWFRVSLSEQIFLIFFLSVHLSVQPHDLTTVLKVKSLPYQVNKIPPSLHHTSLSKRTAFISVMDRWTPREICLLLSHLANSFHGLLEKENKTWHIYQELVGRVAAIHPFDWTGCQRCKSPRTLPHYTCTHTHPLLDSNVCESVCGVISGADPCQPGAPWEEGCSLWGKGGGLTAICGKAKYTTGTE